MSEQLINKERLGYYDKKLKEWLNGDGTADLMQKDGSNYEGSLTLVTPVISSTWDIKKQDGSTHSTNANNSISVENGAKVYYAGTFKIPAISTGQKIPASCDGSFGTTRPLPPGISSAGITRANLTTNTTITVNFYSPKSGLEVSGSKVIKATGNDKTSASASVSFYHRRFWGVSADANVDITTLSSELNNSRAKTIDFNCSGGKYFYFAYPKALGDSTWKVGGLAFSGYTRTEVTITNEYGLQVTYYVYRSSNIQTGSSINAVIA